MNEQCLFFNGDGLLFKCNPLQAIPAAKIAIGYDGANLLTVQEDLCKSTDPSREALCPAFKDILTLGRRSQFAKPVTTNRPVR
jgi:hypothetical protein